MTYQPRSLGQWYYESRCEPKPWGSLTGYEQQSWERAAQAARDMLNSAQLCIELAKEPDRVTTQAEMDEEREALRNIRGHETYWDDVGG